MSDVAVLVIDMMNTYRHPDAEKLVPHVGEIIDPLAELVADARGRDDVDLIYVNDNYGDFTAGFGDIVQSALNGERPDLVEPIAPQEGCRVLTNVRHSAFYATALDAYVRHFPVVVPPDAVAHIDSELSDAALSMMRRNMSAELVPAEKCLD